MKRNNFLIVVVLCVFLLGGVFAAVPQTLNLHGKLTNSSDDILTGTYNLTFKIYDVVTGGSELWGSANNSVTTDSAGIYNFILSDVNLTFDKEYYLGIKVANDAEMTPRINLTSSPYSFTSKNISASGILNDSNINLVGKNITASSGLFSWLGSLVSRITKLFVQDIDFTGNINGSGWINTTANISADYYYGDGSLLTGISTYNATYVAINTTANIQGLLNSTGIYSTPLTINTTANIQNLINSTGIYSTYNATYESQISDLNGSLYWNMSGGFLFPRYSGNVGIGTTSPTHDLNVVGHTNLSGTLWAGNGTLYVNTTNVGIGTTSPTQILDVRGSVSPIVLIANELGGIVGANATISLAGGSGVVRSAQIMGINTGGADNAHAMVFLTSAGSQAPAERMRIDSTGNIGIGTSSPGSRLTINASGGTSATSSLNVTNSTGSGLFLVRDDGNVGIGTGSPSYKLDVAGGAVDIVAKFAATTAIADIILQDSTKYMRLRNSAGEFLVYTNNDAETPIATLNGNVGIGTASPSQKLEVNGNILADNFNATGTHTIVGPDAGSPSENTGVTLVGYQAGYGNEGSYSDFVSYRAGYLNKGDYSTGIGWEAFKNNVGNYSIGIGHEAGEDNAGNYVVGIGYGAGKGNTAKRLVAIGYWAGNQNTGSSLTAIGEFAGNGNIGDGVTVYGSSAGSGNRGGSLIGIGSQAGKDNNGSSVIAIGNWAGYRNIGNYSIGIGTSAISGNTKNYANAYGYYALNYNDGDYAIGIGHYTGWLNKGNYPVGIGYEALKENRGDYVVAIGNDAGRINNGSYVNLMGYYAGYKNTGNYSQGYGYHALRENTGNNVVAIGYSAGYQNTVPDQFILKQGNVNAVPLIQGNFSSGNVGIGTATPQSALDFGNTCRMASMVLWGERGTLASDQALALGNGQTPTGAPMICAGTAHAISCMCSSAADASNHVAFEVMKGGVAQTCDTDEVDDLSTAHTTTGCAVTFSAGDIIGAKSKTLTGTVTECVCTVWVVFN